MRYWKYFLLCFVVIALDQGSKLLVHFNMEMGREGQIMVLGEWFRLYYVLNPGIAFGMNLDFPYSKLLLTLFRLLASGGIAWYLMAKIHQRAHPGFLVCLSLILSGALGNVIDSIFYGKFLEGNVIYNAPTPWFHGQVIDMLYFPMIDTTFPEWVPIWGGDQFLFFSAIFNVADSAIFVGVVTILIFQKKFLGDAKAEAPTDHGTQAAVTVAEQPNPQGETGENTPNDKS